MAWYEKNYRRALVDMHIEAWDERFLADFSPEDYFEDLKRGEIRGAMLYLQSHVGYCYYPTQVGRMHPAFAQRPDAMRRLVELCRADGMNVVGYYSLIFNCLAEREHPEWRMLETDTESRYDRGRRFGLCCPSNRDYVAFVKAQIGEIAAYFPPLDGMFYDMTYWPVFCRCPACRARWSAESGEGDLPQTPDWHDPLWRRYYRSRVRWMGEFAQEITDLTRSLMPSVTVEHNYATSVDVDWSSCSTEAVNAACDYTGGDLHGDLRMHSFSAKYFRAVSKHQPFEHMVSRFDGNLSDHTVTKSQNRMDAEILLNVAHHGASLIIDAIDPTGRMDARVWERIGHSMRQERLYEPYCKGNAIEDVGVLFSSTGKYNSDGQAYDSRTCSLAASTLLASAHIPYGVCGRGEALTLDRFACVTAGGIAGLDEADIDAIERYVRGGGCFFFSGTEDPELLRRLLGAEVTGLTEHRLTYLAPTAGSPIEGDFNAVCPIPMPYRQPTVRASETSTVWATLCLPWTVPGERRFASIHSNPPAEPTDSPAILSATCGDGRVVWSALPLEMSGCESVQDVWLTLLGTLLPTEARSLRAPDAPPEVELLASSDEDGISISAVDLGVTAKRRILPPFAVWIRTARRPRGIERIADGSAVAFTVEDGGVRFTTLPTEVFAMYRISY